MIHGWFREAEVHSWANGEEQLLLPCRCMQDLNLEGSAVFEITSPSESAPQDAPSTSCSSPPTHQFNARRFMSQLHSSSLGHILLTAADIPSTQEFMRRHGTKLADGVVMVADRQSSGKGERRDEGKQTGNPRAGV